MLSLSQNFPPVLRFLSRNGVYSVVSIVSLALGLGSNICLFAALNKIVLRDLPVWRPEQLVSVSLVSADGSHRRDEIPWPLAQAIGERQTVFSGMLGRRDSGIRQLQANGAKYVGVVDAVSSDYFFTLGVKPLIGRAIDASDIDLKRGSNPVAVLSYRCWKDHYAGRGDVLGQVFTLDGIPLTIIGVTGESFTGMSVEGTMEATVPLGLADAFHTQLLATEPLAFVRGRLKPGITSRTSAVA